MAHDTSGDKQEVFQMVEVAGENSPSARHEVRVSAHSRSTFLCRISLVVQPRPTCVRDTSASILSTLFTFTDTETIIMSFSSSSTHMAPVPLPAPTTAPSTADPLPTFNRAPFFPQTPSRPKQDENSVPWGPQRHNRAMARGCRRVSFGPLPERDDIPQTPSKPSRRPKRPRLKRQNTPKHAPFHDGKDERPAPVVRDLFSITSPGEFLAMVAPEQRHTHPAVPESISTSDDEMACDSA
ncbi:hypothetical protein LXA43DRAFT_28021 [Ganoderma leucocontextum]|nr:hypothetical protein LXA43DRAFT_28021 [Ganoderma leucocontextum]